MAPRRPGPPQGVTGVMSEPDQPAPRRSSAGRVTHQAARHTAVRAVAEVLGKLATLAWTIAAVRVLSQGDFGALSFALNVMLLVSALPAWGFDSGLVHQGSRSVDRLPALYTQSLAWQTLLALPVFALAAVLVGSFRPTDEAMIVLLLVLAAGLPELWSQTARAAASVRRKPLGVSTALVTQRFVTAVAIGLALAMGTGVVGVAGAFLAGTVIGWGAQVRATGGLGLRFRRSLVTRTSLVRLLRTTWLLGCSSLVLVVLFRADAVLLGVIAGDEAVAEYVVAYRLLETVLFVSFAINESVFPVMSASVTGTRARRGFEQAMALAGFVYLPFAAVSLIEGERVIADLFGETYVAASASSLAWLAPAPLLFAAGYFAKSLLTSRGRQAPTLTAAVLATVVNLGLNLYLIPDYGAVGAAVATSASFAVQLVALLVGLRIARSRVRVLRPLAVSTGATAGLSGLLVLLDLQLFVELALGGVLYLAVWFVLARRFEPIQVDVVRGLVRRRPDPA